MLTKIYIYLVAAFLATTATARLKIMSPQSLASQFRSK